MIGQGEARAVRLEIAAPHRRRPASEAGELEALPFLIWTMTPDGVIDYHNRHWFEYSGLDEARAADDAAWAGFVHPSDRAACIAALEAGILLGAASEVECRLRRACDGVYRWHLGRAIPLRDANGRIDRWLGTFVDIHEKAAVAERLRFLVEAGKELSESLDADATLHRIVHVAIPFFADWCRVDVKDERGRIRAVAMAHHDPVREGELQYFLANDLLEPRFCPSPARVMRTGISELFQDNAAATLEESATCGEEQEMYRSVGYRSAITVPLRAHGRTFGSMAFVLGDESVRRYTADDVLFAEELGQRAAHAYANAANFGRARDTSGYLQRALLPQTLPVHAGVVLSSEYIPGSDGTLVGGDWYDAFTIDKDTIALSIGDVMGHGVAAATTMASLRYGVRAAVLEGADPAQILSLIDRLIRKEREGEYASCIFGYLNVARGEFSFANAGHPPPMTLDADGTVVIHRVEPEVGLGVGPRGPHAVHTLSCAPGTTLLLYTDGIIEFDRNLILGELRLAQALRTLTADPPSIRAHRLARRVLQLFRAADDIALLAATMVQR